MKVLFEPAPAWTIETFGDAWRVHLPAAPAIAIEVAALAPLPDDVRGWASQALRAGLPPGAMLEIVVATDLETVDGWRMTVVESQVVAGDRRQVLETRMHVFYTFLQYGGVVAVRSSDEAQLDEYRAEILDRAGRARPDFSGEVVALAQLADVPLA